jgi:hypothetical protein
MRRSTAPAAPLAPPATAGHAAPTSPGGLYKTSYAVEVAVACLDGLVVTPIGGQGRGPPRHGEHAEVVATAGKPLVQRWSPPLASGSEQRWSAPLASRWCRVVHTCRVEMELGLHLKADVITFAFCKYF